MYIIEYFWLALRRACRLIGLSRTSFRYRPKNNPDEAIIRARLKEHAQKRKRLGCPRLHVMLRREGFVINHKRTQRIYRGEGLLLRIRRRRKMASALRTEVHRPTRTNHIWSMDFMKDALSSGRKLKGLPEIIIIDNGPEFIGKALDEWAYRRGVKLFFITPGKPVENMYMESFNGKLRDECLNLHYFTRLDQARKVIEEWRVDYNTERPHSSLNNLTPEEFIQSLKEKTPETVAVDNVSINAGYPNS